MGVMESIKLKYLRVLKSIGLNAIALAGFSSASLLTLEILLQSKIVNEDALDTPTYISRELKLNDYSIDQSGETDYYGFRSIDGHNKLDRLSSMQGIGCNIVILGDSFVWGDGVGPQSRWVDLLDKSLKGCRIHSFGKRDWNSLEQFQFYESHLKDIRFDHLLIGYVMNDPHLALRPPNSFYHLDANQKLIYSNWDKKELLVRARATFFGITYDIPLTCSSIKCGVLRLLRALTLPSRGIPKIANRLNIQSIDYIDQKSSSLFNTIFNSYYPLDGDMQDASQIIAFGYNNWQEYLYEDQNFYYWKDSLKSFANNANHSVTFVITATSTDLEVDKSAFHISNTISAIKESGLDLINCSIYYKGTRPRAEWANAADPHPGSGEAKHYASCVNDHMSQTMLH